MKKNNNDLGCRVKTLRKERKLTQDAIAEKLGVKRSSVYLWETGATQPSANNIQKLAMLFNCDIQWLITGVMQKTEHIINTLGLRAKNARIERAMAQEDLANIIGVKRASISMWEKDETRPNGMNLLKLANALNVDVEYLQYGKVKETEDPFKGLSHDAVVVMQAIAKIDKKDRHRIKAMRILLRI